MKKKIDTGIIVKEAKKGSGVYYLFLNKHSYRVAYSVGSFDDAVDLGIKIQPRFRRDPVGTIQAFKDKPATSMTFKQVAEDWIDNVKKPQVSSWTLERYQQVADDYVFPNLGRKPVESITTGVFSAFIEKQYKADKKRGKGTGNIEICRTVVSGTVKRARSRYSIQMPDPTVGVFEALGLLRNKKLESQRTVKFMTDDQIITYLVTAMSVCPRYFETRARLFGFWAS